MNRKALSGLSQIQRPGSTVLDSELKKAQSYQQGAVKPGFSMKEGETETKADSKGTHLQYLKRNSKTGLVAARFQTNGQVSNTEAGPQPNQGAKYTNQCLALKGMWP